MQMKYVFINRLYIYYIMTTEYVPIDKLYSLFTDTDIIEYEVKSDIDIEAVFEMPNEYLMSPSAKSIFDGLTPNEKNDLNTITKMMTIKYYNERKKII